MIELHSLDGSFGYDGWAGLRNPDIFVLRGAALDSLRFQRLDAP